MQNIKRKWREIVIVLLSILLLGCLIAWPNPTVESNTGLQATIDFQGRKIQELQKQVEAGRVIPKEFISIEQVRLWLVTQDIPLNPGWTWEQTNNLQLAALKDGYMIMYSLVRNVGTMQNEFWPFVKVGESCYWIEPFTHDLQQFYPSESGGLKLPDIDLPDFKMPDLLP
jgi:hypothetical protein